MAYYLGSLFGSVLGIWLFTFGFNLAFSKLFKIKSINIRILASTVTTLLYLIITNFITNTTNDVNTLVGYSICIFFGWFIVNSFYSMKFSFREFILSLAYGILFYLVLAVVLGFILGVLHELLGLIYYSSVMGLFSMFLGFGLSTYLIYRHLLPGTRNSNFNYQANHNDNALNSKVKDLKSSAIDNCSNVLKPSSKNPLIVLDDDVMYSEVSVDVSKKQYTYLSRSSDFLSTHTWTYEYHFDGDKLYIRLITELNDAIEGTYYLVQDNVVLESEIRKRVGDYLLDSILEERRKKVEWHEYKAPEIRYFIMSMHPDVFSQMELRKSARKYLENLKNGFDNFLNGARQLEIFVKETETGYELKSKEHCSPTEEEAVRLYFDEKSLSSFGLTAMEILMKKEYEKQILKILGEQK
jgi:hypothetical protein